MAQGMQVLVVDDEAAICQSLSAWLTKEGYHVETASSGPEALDYQTDRHFDLYLLDIKMPGMDGLEVLAKFREAQPDATVITPVPIPSLLWISLNILIVLVL